MPSIRETAHQRLFALISSISPPGAGEVRVTRNEALAVRLDEVASVWLNLVDGAPEPREELLGGGYGDGPVEFDLAADLEIAVTAATQPARDTLFDETALAVAAAIAADETLSGAVTAARAEALTDIETEALGRGGALVKTAVLPLKCLYTAPGMTG